jgi:hypothetical protein
MQSLIIRKSRLTALPTMMIAALLAAAAILAVVQGDRPVLGFGILVVAVLLGKPAIGALRDRSPWLQLDAAGVHYRGSDSGTLRTIPWEDVVDARPAFRGGRAESMIIEVRLPESVTPSPAWWQRLLRRPPQPVDSREIRIELHTTGMSGVRVANTVLSYREAWDEATAAASGRPRLFRRLIRGDFA